MEALELSLRDINGGRDINEIISEVDTQNVSPFTILYNFDKHIQQNYNHKPVNLSGLDWVVRSEMYVCLPGLGKILLL